MITLEGAVRNQPVLSGLGRPADRQRNTLLKVQGAMLDRAHLEEWARELGLTDLLRRALDDAGLP